MSLIQKTRTVYIISSALTPKVYIGSTSENLSRRLGKHKNNNKKCSAIEIIQLGQYKISPLCIVENCTRKEIETKEKDFIFCFKDICVNISGTKNSNSRDYKAPCILSGRVAANKKIKNECFICGGKYTNSDKAKHFKTKKHMDCIQNLM